MWMILNSFDSPQPSPFQLIQNRTIKYSIFKQQQNLSKRHIVLSNLVSASIVARFIFVLINVSENENFQVKFIKGLSKGLNFLLFELSKKNPSADPPTNLPRSLKRKFPFFNPSLNIISKNLKNNSKSLNYVSPCDSY